MVEHDHVVILTLFELRAFVAPPDVKAAMNDIKPVATVPQIR
jgi:hypothetical protein